MEAALTDQIPSHLRPITFASTELFLDLIYGLQSFAKVDLESIYILLCVTDATMRPFMLDTETPRNVLHSERPPNAIRGAISRRAIADKTGLARETVRRKTRELANLGLVQIDDEDLVRSAQGLGNREFQRVVEAAHNAVLRYLDRVRSFGVERTSPFKSEP